MNKFLTNLNSNILVSIDCETTGLDPRAHDIIQVAMIPLDGDLRPDGKIVPFIHELIPRRIDNIDPDAMRVHKKRLCEIMLRGSDAYHAQDLFLDWFQNLNLGFKKQIIPVGCNYPFDRGFLVDWLGHLTYEMCFSSHYRDVMAIADFLMDRAGYRCEEFTYKHTNLATLANACKIERSKAHDAVDDARVAAEVYRHLVLN